MDPAASPNLGVYATWIPDEPGFRGIRDLDPPASADLGVYEHKNKT